MGLGESGCLFVLGLGGVGGMVVDGAGDEFEFFVLFDQEDVDAVRQLVLPAEGLVEMVL